MSTAQTLPARPNLEFLKKTAKERLREMRRADAGAKLALAHLAVAREHGFSSWRKLKAYIEEFQRAHEAAAPKREQAEAFLEVVRKGDAKDARRLLRESPGLANAAFDD